VADLTLITVTHDTWDTYTSRLAEQVFRYVDPDSYAQWFMVDNASPDGDKIAKAMTSFPPEHRRKFTLVRADENIGDLPQYNRVVDRWVGTDAVLCVSTDMRIFAETVPWFNFLLSLYDIAGMPGPKIPKSVADDEDNPWHWIPKLMLDRGFDTFEDTGHIQSHCVGFRREPFQDVGGFWEPEDRNYLDKGNLIASEMILSIKMRNAGYRMLAVNVPMHHYGNQMSLQDMQDFDRARGWDVFWDTEEEEFGVMRIG